MDTTLSYVSHISQALNRAKSGGRSLHYILKYKALTSLQIKLLDLNSSHFWLPILTTPDHSKVMPNKFPKKPQTPCIGVVHEPRSVSFLTKCQTNRNPLIIQFMQIGNVEKNLPRTHLFSQLLFILQSQNQIFDPQGRVVFYASNYSQSRF